MQGENSLIECCPFVRVSNFIQTPSVDGRTLSYGNPIPGGSPDVVLYPDVAAFADNRFDCCHLLQCSVVHHGTGKASGIRSCYSCQTNRLRTICSKRRNSVFGALGSIRTSGSNLKPWVTCSWSKRLNSM